MKHTSLITIGITCFNCEKTITKAIKSAINQDWKNKEIIIIDDFSTDNSKKIISKFKKKFPQLKVIYNKKNYGYPYCLNLIVSKAKGKFIAFFDGDDESVISRLTYQYKKYFKFNLQKKNNHILVYSNRKINFNQKKSILAIGRKKPEPHGEIVANYILNIKKKSTNYCWGMFGSCTLFIEKKIFQEMGCFDIKFRRCAELDFAIRAAQKGSYFISVNKNLIKQNITLGSHKTLKKDLYYRILLAEKYKKYLKHNHLYLSSKFNTKAWYWFVKGNNFLGYLFRLFYYLSLIKNKVYIN